MPPALATFLWLLLLFLLLRYDPAKEPGVSVAIWVPVIWIFFVASHLPAQWLGISYGSMAQAFEEGNSLDRTVFLVFILSAIGILISRSFRWTNFFVRNLALTTLLFFALVSVLWSDFPFITLKRWFRDFGHYLVILVALSDPRPLDAVRTLFRRLSYLLIPLSILLIKYYPSLGMQYSQWTGDAMFVGASNSKNTFGAVCLVSGLFFFWDTVNRWPNRNERRVKRIILVNFFFCAMTLWLLRLADSATSRVCLAIGCLVILAVHSRWGRRHITFITVLIPTCACLLLILTFGLDLNGELASYLGRNATFTDRTYIWKILFGMNINPFFGTGYEGFWLGSRLEWLWRQKYTVGINEAHNGFLEVYLDLGFIGVFLLVCLLIASYRNVCKKLHTLPGSASLGLALWTVTIFYNMTEAAFIGFHLIWVIFLMEAMAVPERAEVPVPMVARSDEVRPTTRLGGFGLGAKVHRLQNVVQSSKD